MSSPGAGPAPFDPRSWFRGLRSAPRGAYERAVAALRLGRPDEALAELDAALAEAPDGAARARAHNKRGVAMIALARRDDALEAFCAALECDDRSVDALVNIGNLAYESGHARDALDYYAAALRIEPRLGRAYLGVAAARKALGDRAASVKALRAAGKWEGRFRRRA